MPARKPLFTLTVEQHLKLNRWIVLLFRPFDGPILRWRHRRALRRIEALERELFPEWFPVPVTVANGIASRETNEPYHDPPPPPPSARGKVVREYDFSLKAQNYSKFFDPTKELVDRVAERRFCRECGSRVQIWLDRPNYNDGHFLCYRCDAGHVASTPFDGPIDARPARFKAFVERHTVDVNFASELTPQLPPATVSM